MTYLASTMESSYSEHASDGDLLLRKTCDRWNTFHSIWADSTKPTQRLRNNLGLLFLALQTAYHVSRRSVIGVLALHLLTSASVAATLLLTRAAIGELQNFLTRVAEAEQRLILAAGWLAISLAVARLAQLTNGRIRARMISKLDRHCEAVFLISRLSAPVHEFFDQSLQRKIDEARAKGVYAVSRTADQFLALTAGTLLPLAVTVGLAAWVNCFLALAVLGAAIPVIWGSARTRKLSKNHPDKGADSSKKRWEIADQLLMSDGILERKLHGLSDALFQQYREISRQNLEDRQGRANNLSRLAVGNAILNGAGIIIGYGFALALFLSGSIAAGDAGLVIMAVRSSRKFTLGGTRSYFKLVENLSDYRGLLFFFSAAREEDEVPPVDYAPPVHNQPETVKFERVSFTYPGNGRSVFNDITFDIRPGEVVAVRGRNGSGKSTLLRLATGLFNPTVGMVSFGAGSRSNTDVAYCASDSPKYPLTLAESVAGLHGRDSYTMRKIGAALKAVGLCDSLSRDGVHYQSVLNSRGWGGAGLSKGQWQRLALARTFFKGANLIVLDEPSNGLDSAAEETLRRLLRTAAAEGRSVLMATHSDKLMKEAHRVVDLDS